MTLSQSPTRDYRFVGNCILSELWRKPIVKVSKLYLAEVLWLMTLGHLRIAHSTDQHMFVYLNPEARA